MFFRILTILKYSINFPLIIFILTIKSPIFLAQSYDYNYFRNFSMKSPFALQSSFANNLDLFNYRNKSSVSINYSNFNFFFFNDYGANLLKTLSKNLREQSETFIAIENELTNFANLGIIGRKIYYSDNKSSYNKSNLEQIGLYTILRHNQIGKIILLSGVSSREHTNKINRGWHIDSKLESEYIKISDFSLNANINLYNESASPIINQESKIAIALDYNEKELFYNKLEFERKEYRSAFYVLTDSIFLRNFNKDRNITDRKETEIAISNNLKIENLIKNASFFLNLKYSEKFIKRKIKYKAFFLFENNIYDANNSQENFGAETFFLWEEKNWTLKGKFEYKEKEESFLLAKAEYVPETIFILKEKNEKLKNNIVDWKSVAIEYSIKISENDLFKIAASNIKKQYNTPAIENYDDRDELNAFAKLTYVKTFNPIFTSIVSLEGSQSEVAYISGYKSSNNYVNRRLKLSFEQNMSGQVLTNLGYFEVSSNYTTYKYSKLFENLDDFYFRNLILNDTFKLKLSKFEIESRFFLKLSEQGKLNWNKFKVSPGTYWHERNFIFLIFFNPSKARIGTGIKNFFSERYFYLTIKKKNLSAKYSFWGPIIEAQYQPAANMDMRLNSYVEYPFTADKFKKRTFFEFSMVYFL